MKQGLNIKLGQQLSMTPQLQQAIRLLQLSTLDLQQEVQQALESNPLLEQAEDFSDDKAAASDTQPVDSTLESSLPKELETDTSWDDTYDLSSSDAHVSNATDSNLLETLNAEELGLKDHLLWQINSSKLNIQDRIIAETLIESIDHRGYLSQPLIDIYQDLSEELILDMEDLEAVLVYIQRLDPLGVGARSLEECLTLQLEKLYATHPLYRKTRSLLEKNLDLLQKRDYKRIKRTLNISEGEYTDLIELLQSLDPHPGLAFENNTTEYISPDVYINKADNGQWFVSLNSSNEINIRINEHYKGLIKEINNDADAQYLRDNLQQANSLIKAIENRNSTILRVAEEILKRQSDFLKYGVQALKPMILKNIATELDLHESTISRVTNQKYMLTPHGVFELKFFFSSHVATNTGGECSSTAIRAMIQELIKAENHQKPLSDNKLTTLLKEQGIKVARRTVTKYRESMTIPSSRERKTLA